LSTASGREQLLIDEGPVEQILKTILAVIVTTRGLSHESDIDHVNAACALSSLDLRLRFRLKFRLRLRFRPRDDRSDLAFDSLRTWSGRTFRTRRQSTQNHIRLPAMRVEARGNPMVPDESRCVF
jgi:hypothetical protein